MWTWPPVALTLMLAATLTVMSGATLSPALPQIEAAFEGAPNAAMLVRLVLTIPALFIVIGAPIAGWFVDRYGRRTLLLGSLVVYAAAGSSGLYANTLPELLVGRAVLGLAVAGIMTTSTTLLIDYFEGPDRIKLLGVQAAFASGGGVVFVLLGGILTEFGWRTPFLIYLASIGVLALAALYLPEPKRPPLEPAPPGPDRGRLLVWAIYASAFMSQLAFYTIPVHLPFYLRDTFGLVGAGAGFAIATSTFCIAIVSLNYGRLRARFAYHQMIAFAFLLMGAGFCVVGLAWALAPMLLGLAMIGAAFGFSMPSSSNWLAEIATGANRGRIMGGMGTAVFLGQFASPILTGPLVAATSLSISYEVVGAALLTAGAAAGLVLRRATQAPAAG